VAQTNLWQRPSKGQAVPIIASGTARPNLIACQVLAIVRFVLVFVIPVFAFLLSIHQIKGGWDDGEITAAFSRTLAEAGRFSLTPVSEKVEGVSSLTWTFLLTIPYYLFHNVVAIVVSMKLLAAGSFLLALILFKRLSFRLLRSESLSDISTIMLALIAAPMLETLNGMEMNLYMLLALLLVDVLTEFRPMIGRVFWIVALSAALVATRFEAPFLLTVVILGLFFIGDRKSSFQLAAATAASYAAIELWRFHTFGVWMPNTVYAKMHPPYSPPHIVAALVERRVATLLEYVSVFGMPLLVVLAGAVVMRALRHPSIQKLVNARRVSAFVAIPVVLIAVSERFYPSLPYLLSKNRVYTLASAGFLVAAIALSTLNRRPKNALAKLTVLLAAAGIAFGMVFGKNWGYDGRMFVAYIPFLVLATAYFVNDYAPSEHWAAVVLLTAVVVQVPAWASTAQLAWKHGDPVPVKGIEATGLAADAVRQIVRFDSLSFLTPDVGGSSLCCEHLEIEDSALLANAYLAHRGYGSFDEYMKLRLPEVIEAHGAWSEYSGVYRSELMKDYSPVVVDGSRFLVRSDVYARLYSRLQTTTGAHTVSGAACFGDIEHSSWDDAFVLARSCLYIPADDLLSSDIPPR
jgi:hypothetical protein